MRIGIVPVLNGHSGGIYQISKTILTTLYHLESENEFIVFTEDPAFLGFLGDEKKGWRILPFKPFSLGRVVGKYFRRFAGTRAHDQALWAPAPAPVLEEDEVFDVDVINYRPDQGRWFVRNGADLMLYPAPSVHSFEAGITYIVALHSLRYRLYEEFPSEVEGTALEHYEYLVRNSVRFAALVIVDSEALKDDLLNRFGSLGLSEEKIRILAPSMSSYLDEQIPEEEKQRVLQKYSVFEPYLFFPAAYLPHKNHVRLLDALEILENEYTLRIPVVMCGSSVGAARKAWHQEVLREVQSRGRDDQVTCLPYIADDGMSALYSGARLVTILNGIGTSSLVVPEAWAFRCALIAPRIRGIREQVGDAGILVNPASAEEIAETIRKLWTEPATRTHLAELGYQKHLAHSPGLYSSRWAAILSDAQQFVETETDS